MEFTNVNTGIKRYRKTKEIFQDTGNPTGIVNDNLDTDPNYFPDVFDSNHCGIVEHRILNIAPLNPSGAAEINGSPYGSGTIIPINTVAISSTGTTMFTYELNQPIKFKIIPSSGSMILRLYSYSDATFNNYVNLPTFSDSSFIYEFIMDGNITLHAVFVERSLLTVVTEPYFSLGGIMIGTGATGTGGASMPTLPIEEGSGYTGTVLMQDNSFSVFSLGKQSGGIETISVPKNYNLIFYSNPSNYPYSTSVDYGIDGEGLFVTDSLGSTIYEPFERGIFPGSSVPTNSKQIHLEISEDYIIRGNAYLSSLGTPPPIVYNSIIHLQEVRIQNNYHGGGISTRFQNENYQESFNLMPEFIEYSSFTSSIAPPLPPPQLHIKNNGIIDNYVIIGGVSKSIQIGETEVFEMSEIGTWDNLDINFKSNDGLEGGEYKQFNYNIAFVGIKIEDNSSPISTQWENVDDNNNYNIDFNYEMLSSESLSTIKNFYVTQKFGKLSTLYNESAHICTTGYSDLIFDSMDFNGMLFYKSSVSYSFLLQLSNYPISNFTCTGTSISESFRIID